jgi:hypothetical protein
MSDGFHIDDNFIEEVFGIYSFKKLADPKSADAFLKWYAEETKNKDEVEVYEETLYAIERKRWIEEGFRQEDFRVLGEVILGFWERDTLDKFALEHGKTERLIIEKLHFFAEKGDVSVEASLEFIDKPSYATVWVEVEVPWSFTGRGALFEIKGNFEGAVKRIGNFFDLAGAYRGAVADMIMDLAEKHRVVVNFIWHITRVYTYPRKDFAGALRRIQSFLNEYNPKIIRRKALQKLNTRNHPTRH